MQAAFLKVCTIDTCMHGCKHIILLLAENSRTRPSQVFGLFCKYDTAQRGCLTLANVYKMIGEKKSIFGDSLFELIGKRGIHEV